MPHCDPESLSLAALGEPLTPHDAEHLSDCPPCRAELASLREVVHAVRHPAPAGTAVEPVEPVAPPASVWQQIAARTGVTAVPASLAAPADPPTGSDERPAPVSSVTPVSSVAPVVPLPDRPRPERRRLLAVAATALLVGGAGGALLTQWWQGRGAEPPPTVLARVELARLPGGPAASGTASVGAVGPARVLMVDVSALPPVDGFREVWLIDPTVSRMIPVGVLDGVHGTFALPAGLSLAAYPIVDISDEPLDGDPAHSGHSVLRGTISS